MAMVRHGVIQPVDLVDEDGVSIIDPTQGVPVHLQSGSVTIQNLTVSDFDVTDRSDRELGEVAVNNLPATQDVSIIDPLPAGTNALGSVDVDNFPTSYPVDDGDNGALGATTDHAASTDTGTASLISLMKRLLSKLTAGIDTTVDNFPMSYVIGDGDNAALGDTSDTAALSDTDPATLIALMKRLLVKLSTDTFSVLVIGTAQDLRGLAASKPDADAVPVGTTYWSVDTDAPGEAKEVSDGGNWLSMASS